MLKRSDKMFDLFNKYDRGSVSIKNYRTTIYDDGAT